MAEKVNIKFNGQKHHILNTRTGEPKSVNGGGTTLVDQAEAEELCSAPYINCEKVDSEGKAIKDEKDEPNQKTPLQEPKSQPATRPANTNPEKEGDK